MKVRAVALGEEERSNAIGTVELECTPFGLVIAYLGVGAFSEGYAPGALTHGTLVSIPYQEIESVRFEGNRLYLELPKARTPHHRLALGGFSVGDGTHRHELYRQRLVLRTGAFGTAVLAALLTALAVPRLSPSSGAAIGLAIAGVLAGTILAVGFFIDKKLVSGQLEGEAAQNALASELAMYLPRLVQLDRPRPKAAKPTPLPDFQGLLPRTVMAIAITMAAGGLAAVLIAKWMMTSPEAVAQATSTPTSDGRSSDIEVAAAPPPPQKEPEPTVARDTPASAPPVTSTAPGTAASPTSLGDVSRTGQCQCHRAASVLWETAVPKLSVLVLSTRLRQAERRKHLELDIAVVNNSNEELSDITLRVNFYERDPAPSNRRHFSRHRVLFFEGPLRPGQAIKWSTEARGVEFELENPIEGDIGPGGDGAASVAALSELLSANHRPVRMHAAMMLAYLGDPRAREAVLELQDALRQEEAPYLRRVLASMGQLIPCEVNVSHGGNHRSISACVYNTSDAKQENLRLKVNALEGPASLSHPVGQPPTLLGEGSWNIPGALAPREGARVKTSFDLASVQATSAKTFEVLVGRQGEAF